MARSQSRAAIIGGGFYAGPVRRPRTSFKRRRWNRFRRRVMSASSASFTVLRTQPIADPVTSTSLSTFTWGLTQNTDAQPSLTELIAGVQMTFVSPIVYGYYDLYGTIGQNTDDIYTVSGGEIYMTGQPKIGIPGNFRQHFIADPDFTSVGDNPGLQGWNPTFTDPSLSGQWMDTSYSIRQSRLGMTVTNQGNHTITITEYKCVCRRDLINGWSNGSGFNFLKTTATMQPHLDLYMNIGRYDMTIENKTNPGSTWNSYLPGTTPFQNPVFCRYVRVLTSRKFVLGPGQEMKSWMSRSRPMKVNLGDAGRDAPWGRKGAYFMLYTAVANRAYNPNAKDLATQGTISLGAEATVRYEITMTPAGSTRIFNNDYRQRLMGATFAASNFHLRNPLNAGDSTTAPAPEGPI